MWKGPTNTYQTHQQHIHPFISAHTFGQTPLDDNNLKERGRVMVWIDLTQFDHPPHWIKWEGWERVKGQATDAWEGLRK